MYRTDPVQDRETKLTGGLWLTKLDEFWIYEVQVTVPQRRCPDPLLFPMEEKKPATNPNKETKYKGSRILAEQNQSPWESLQEKHKMGEFFKPSRTSTIMGMQTQQD